MTRLAAVCSLSGAPGATTLALALAAAWPEPETATVIEADASGGDIAAWRHLPASPGLVELAAASRLDGPQRRARPEDFTQVLPGGLRACTAPSAADRAANAVALLAENTEALTSGNGIVVVDLGRMAPRSPAVRLAAAAHATLLVANDDVAHLKRVRDALPALKAGISNLELAVTTGPHDDAALQEAIGAPVRARIPADRPSASLLRGDSVPPRRWSRRPLLATARRLAGELDSQMNSRPVSAP
ncbi:hypothetical protein [Nocardiopsis chromatogenes]|uniref:hypothetical protein n=1 Tax=Nocardiopsis chromatogenes TaxID=280239 RepID=UPI000344B06D|nr:hypothetical protein [Nocardiopsis chromatogenes]